ncbi:MAG: VWA domain-containing protein [Planctomycetaceae bacterium]|nr:VWA domain-containing protein [Planctomycetaceae bacterium]
MSWFPGFSTAATGAWLFLLLIPLIIFYFLKLRRPQLQIASLALWQQVISDQRVNSPFQKFKRNLLLLLQILLLSLIALAAMQPFLKGDAENSQYLPIMIDTSASMAAVDEAGQSRLDLAKEQVREIIEGLLPGQQLTLVTVGSTARRLTEFTDNKPLLLSALNGIETSDVPSRFEDGLQLAQAMTRTFKIDQVRLYSDGNLPTRKLPTGDEVASVDFDLSYALDFFVLPTAGRNLGVTALNARRASVDEWDVFVRVEAGVAESASGQLELLVNGAPLREAEPLSLEAGASQRLVFRVDASQPAHIEARLTADGHDALKSDNRAFLDLPVGRDLVVYCAPSLAMYRHALSQMPGILMEPNAEGKSDHVSYDLLISDTADDLSKEAATSLLVGAVPPEVKPLITIETGLAEVVDWKREASLLQHVQLREVVITDLPKRATGIEDGDFEELGYEILAFGNESPLILRKRDGPKLLYSLLFHTDRSTLPYRVGFPIMIQNLITEALQQASLSELRALATGALPPLSVDPKTAYQVVGPGPAMSLVSNDEGVLDNVPAQTVGEYEVRQGGELIQQFGVSLINSTETSLKGVNEIQFREVKVGAESERVKTDKPLWSTLAAMAFGILLLEWWYFQKRPSGMPA